jgi:hypothetical protein
MPRIVLAFALMFSLLGPVNARGKGTNRYESSELLIASQGTSRAVIVVAAGAGKWERRAADDLKKYVALMTGAHIPIVNSVDNTRPNILVGKVALANDPLTRAALLRTAKKNPVYRSDAISIRREGNRIYVAGSNDESQYFAVSWLLQKWGCRWYMPTDFGEVIPKTTHLSIGHVDFAYSPPFEVRGYWISWNGDTAGADDFRHRNFMSEVPPPPGHALDQYTNDIAPAGGSHFNVPFTDPRTADHVAAKIEGDYAAGKDISLSIADGLYSNNYPGDRAIGDDYDPYMLEPSMTDAMMTLYNHVSRQLRKKYPLSPSKLGALAYSNATMPPQNVGVIEPNIVMWLAPIDIDPNHSMDDRRSPPRQEYRAMMERWSKLLNGRLAIYDYDQGMLVWRNLPDPSQQVFARDVKIYRDAGVLGFQTESRGALATTFLNLFFRGQLMWNPDANVSRLLKEFYAGFYGPAAEPMSRYWGRIFNAWAETPVTEHEYFVIPVIYTLQLVQELRDDLEAAESAVRVSVKDGQETPMLAERMRFTRESFSMIEAYAATGTAAARDADYVTAVADGQRSLAAQQALRSDNPLFVSGLIGGENGPAWLAGEVKQYEALKSLTDGSKGVLVYRLPLTWAFKTEHPLPAGPRYNGPEGATPFGDDHLARENPNSANGWHSIRTDTYLQAQDGMGPGREDGLGHYWYRSSFNVSETALKGKLHLIFPGLFNEAWLYLNGKLVGYRPYTEPWWQTDYVLMWDVDLTGRLRPGMNEIAFRGYNPHHFGGMFRRPFLYQSLRDPPARAS